MSPEALRPHAAVHFLISWVPVEPQEGRDIDTETGGQHSRWQKLLCSHLKGLLWCFSELESGGLCPQPPVPLTLGLAAGEAHLSGRPQGCLGLLDPRRSQGPWQRPVGTESAAGAAEQGSGQGRWLAGWPSSSEDKEVKLKTCGSLR